MQHSQRQAHHLQILGPSRRRNISGLCAHIKNDAPLQPGDEEVCSFANHFFLNSGQSVEYNGARAALDIVHGGVDGEGACNRECEPSQECVWGCHFCYIVLCCVMLLMDDALGVED